MADLIISKKETTPQSQNATDGNLTLTDAGSVRVNLEGAYSGGKSPTSAVQSTASDEASNTITLDGAISIKDVTTDPDESTSHYTYGLLVANTATTGTKEAHADYTATIKTENGSTIDVTRDTTSQKDVVVSGIGSKNSDTYGSYNAALLVFGDGNGKFLDAITVSTTNSNVDNGGSIMAYGISSNASVITFKDELAAAINVTATNKKTATAKGINNDAAGIAFQNGISSAITATATSKTSYSSATAINAPQSNLVIGTENKEADLAGTITVEATGASKSVYMSNTATGLIGSNIYIYGNITKNITATSSDKDSAEAKAYGLKSGGSGTIDITGKVAGAIKATATAAANTAEAYGLIGGTATTIGGGITQDITATATGAATTEASATTKAYGITFYNSGTVTIGTKDTTVTAIGGDITATATGKATLTGDGETGYAGNAAAYGINGASVTLNGDVTGDMTATATATSVTQSDGTVVGGTAEAYSINASDGAVSITGALAGDINASAISTANYARAYGIKASGAVSVAGINGAITATANGADGGLSFAYGIRSSGGLTVNGDISKAITVKVTATPTGGSSADGYGIYGEKVDVKGDITGAVTATVTANSVKQASGFAASGTASAFGIAGSSKGGTSISGKLAGDISATATSKGNRSTAYGLYASNKTNVVVSKGITGDITATATGTAKVGTDTEGKGLDTTTNAYGIYTAGANGSVVITGAEDESGNKTAIGGAITATATGSAMLGQSKDVEDGKVYMGSAAAYAITAIAGAVTLNGDVTGDLTATAMAKGLAQTDGTVVSGTATAYGINAKNAVTITGELAGDINAAAITDANAANAYGINGASVVVTKGITQDITATATGAATATAETTTTAYGINSTNSVTIGTASETETAIGGAITAKATGSATLTGDGATGYAGNAAAYGINGSSVTLNGDVTGDITAAATATSVTQSNGAEVGGTAYAYGINAASGALNITGALAGDIKAAAVAKSNTVKAYGIYASTEADINAINAVITATANAANGACSYAYGVKSEGRVTVTGDITEAITAKVTTASFQTIAAKGYGISGSKVDVGGDITGAVTVTVTANSVEQKNGYKISGSASATGISGSYQGGISISGTLAGDIKVTATNKANLATADGLYTSNGTDVTVSNGITGAITATATGTAKVGGVTDEGEITTGQSTNTTAYGIRSNRDVSISGGTDADKTAIGGAITATATGSAMLGYDPNNPDGTVYAGNAEAQAINARNGAVTIDGDVTGDITATAKANSLAQAGGEEVGGTATAYGIYAKSAVSVTGELAGDITATATAEANTATAYGIYAEGNVDLTGAVSGVISATATSVTTYAYAFGIDGEGSALNAGSDLGTIRVSAAGVGDDVKAFGIYGNSLTYTGDRLTANVAVKSSSTAFGISVDSITKKDGTAGVAKLNVSVTGDVSATGITLKDEADLTLQESSITAHASQAESLFAVGDTAQKITLEKSTLAGGVNLEGGNDTLTLKGSSMITGDVDMGNDTDTLSISSGSRITGDVKNTESTTLVLDNLSYASLVLWEGASFGGGTLTLDFSSEMLKGVTADGVTFNLLKDTDSEWSGTSVNLTVDGSGMSQTLTQGTEQAFGSFKYLLGASADSKTLTVTVTRTGGTAEDPGIVIDTDKPTISVDTSASTFKQGDTFWFKQGAVATVTGTDATSGVHYLTRTDGDWTYNISGDTATLDLELELDAAATVSYTATDKQGNVSEATTVKYNVDGSEPTIAGTAVSGAREVDGAYWIKKGDAASVGATVTDAKSGVKGVQFNGDTVAVGAGDAYSKAYDTATEHGLADYTLAATDNVGNAADETLQIGVDGTPVEITLSAIGEGASAGENSVWAKAGTTFSLVAAFTDALSGVNADSVTLNGETIALGAGDEYTKILVAPEDGEEFTLTFAAEDNVGNKVEKSVYVGFDDTAPVIGEVAVGESYKSGENAYWVKQNADVTVGATVTDDKSGVKEVTFNDVARAGIDGVYAVSYDTSEEHGQTAYVIAATDNVGNEAEAKTMTIGVDGTGPTITVTKDPTALSASGVTVTADISDGEGSGVAESLYSLDDGTTWTAYTGAITVTQNVKILFKATDNVGNVSEATEYVMNAAAITITADSATKMYDGTALTAGYTFNEAALIAGDVLTATVEGTITDVETATNEVTSYKVMRGDQDVTSDYIFNTSVDGTLEITQRDVTLTSASATKQWDGVPLTNDSVTESGSGFVAGEGATYNVTGLQTDPGTSANSFTYTFNNGTKASNYAITTVEGTLAVIENQISPTVTIDADTTTLLETISFTATATDNIKVAKFEYSTDNGETWVDLEDGAASVTATMIASVNGTWKFRAADDRGNVSETASVTFSNINQGGRKVEVSGDTPVVVKEPTQTETIDLRGGTLDASQGSIAADSLVASEGDNSFIGSTEAIGSVGVAEGATLDLDLAQYDDLNGRGALESKGQLNVSATDGGTLDLDHLAGVFTNDSLDSVAFAQDLDESINKLAFYTSKVVYKAGEDRRTTTVKSGTDEAKAIGFGNAVGTAKADTITFGKDTDVTLGTVGKTIDFLKGTNTVKVERNAHAAIASDLVNVTRISLASGTQQGTSLDLANVTFAENRSGRLVTGSNADVTVGDVTGSSKVDRLYFHRNNEATLGDVSLGAGSDEVCLCQYSTMSIDLLDFGDGKDTLRLRANAQATVGTLDFGDGARDTLALGAGSTLTVGTLDVDSLDKLTLGKNATLVLSDGAQVDAMKEKFAKYSDQIQLAPVA